MNTTFKVLLAPLLMLSMSAAAQTNTESSNDIREDQLLTLSTPMMNFQLHQPETEELVAPEIQISQRDLASLVIQSQDQKITTAKTKDLTDIELSTSIAMLSLITVED